MRGVSGYCQVATVRHEQTVEYSISERNETDAKTVNAKAEREKGALVTASPKTRMMRARASSSKMYEHIR